MRFDLCRKCLQNLILKREAMCYYTGNFNFPQFLQYSAVVNDNDESVLSTTEICERCSIKGKVTNQFLVGICFAANASSTIS